MTKHVTLAFFQLSAIGGRDKARARTEACPSDIARPRTIGVAECCNGLWRIGGSGLKQTRAQTTQSFGGALIGQSASYNTCGE